MDKTIIIGYLLELDYKLVPKDKAKTKIPTNGPQRVFAPKTPKDSLIIYRSRPYFDTHAKKELNGIFIFYDHLSRTIKAYSNKGFKTVIEKITYRNLHKKNWYHEFGKYYPITSHPDTVTMILGRFSVSVKTGIHG